MSSLMKHLSITVVIPGLIALSIAPAASGAVRKDPPASIHGAVYVPSNAYNAPQLWKNFNIEETFRDFGYARETNMDALRVWASYEFWKMDPATFQTEVDQMLGAAHDSNIRILFSLF
jgi:hypothetical protein